MHPVRQLAVCFVVAFCVPSVVDCVDENAALQNTFDVCSLLECTRFPLPVSIASSQPHIPQVSIYEPEQDSIFLLGTFMDKNMTLSFEVGGVNVTAETQVWRCRVMVGNAVVADYPVSRCLTPVTLVISELPHGSYVVAVEVLDAYGLRASQTRSFSVFSPSRTELSPPAPTRPHQQTVSEHSSEMNRRDRIAESRFGFSASLIRLTAPVPGSSFSTTQVPFSFTLAPALRNLTATMEVVLDGVVVQSVTGLPCFPRHQEDKMKKSKDDFDSLVFKMGLSDEPPPEDINVPRAAPMKWCDRESFLTITEAGKHTVLVRFRFGTRVISSPKHDFTVHDVHVPPPASCSVYERRSPSPQCAAQLLKGEGVWTQLNSTTPSWSLPECPCLQRVTQSTVYQVREGLHIIPSANVATVLWIGDSTDIAVVHAASRALGLSCSKCCSKHAVQCLRCRDKLNLLELMAIACTSEKAAASLLWEVPAGAPSEYPAVACADELIPMGQRPDILVVAVTGPLMAGYKKAFDTGDSEAVSPSTYIPRGRMQQEVYSSLLAERFIEFWSRHFLDPGSIQAQRLVVRTAVPALDSLSHQPGDRIWVTQLNHFVRSTTGVCDIPVLHADRILLGVPLDATAPPQACINNSECVGECVAEYMWGLVCPVDSTMALALFDAFVGVVRVSRVV